MTFPLVASLKHTARQVGTIAMGIWHYSDDCVITVPPDVLCIDEVGYLSYSNRHADLLFEIINRRYENKSTLITTNRPFSEWGEVFPGAACVVSLIDRLIHHAEIITFEGESYRLKEAKERADKKQQKRGKETNGEKS